MNHISGEIIREMEGSTNLPFVVIQQIERGLKALVTSDGQVDVESSSALR